MNLTTEYPLTEGYYLVCDILCTLVLNEHNGNKELEQDLLYIAF